MNNIISQPHDNERRFLFSIPGSPATEFKVVSFEGEEEISTLYRFELLLASADCDIKAKSVVGKEAHFTLNDGFESGSSAIYRGLVEQFTLQHQVSGLTFYRAVLVPRLWKLESYRRSEIYLNKERHEIVRHVMNLAGLLSSEYEFRIKNSGEDIPVWDYICQYQESYLAFISRWCERLGIYWWFEDIDGREKAVFCNTHAGHKDKAISLRYQPAGELDANPVEIRRIQKLEQHYQILPKQVVVMDYFHKEGNGELQGTAEVDADGMGEIVLYGEHLRNNEEARLIASLRAEGIRCRSEQFQGHSNATGLRCGHFIEIDGHFRADFNRRLLVTRIKHQGSQAGLLLAGLDPQAIGARHAGAGGNDFYLAEFTAIASDVQYRPEIRHPWPKIEGTLNAFIDGEGEGKYAELNEKGEYKIQIPFDITHKGAQRSSAWIRKSSQYAGSDHGMHLPLHKGTEVLLSFINGDPDQPVIIGAIPNSMNPNVVTNDNQRQSRILTAGGNEIVLHDQAGRQYILLQTPLGNTSLRMGALDAAAGSNAAQGDIWINTDNGNFGVTTGSSSATAPTDGISLTAYTDDITLTSSQGNITLNTLNGNINQNIKGDSNTTVEGSSSVWTTEDKTTYTYGDTTSYFAGAENSVLMGAKNSLYVGLCENFYLGAYLNQYLLKWDSTVTKYEWTGFEKKVAGVRMKTVGTKIDSVLSHIYTVPARVSNYVAEVKAHRAEIAQKELEAKQIAIAMKQAEADLKQIEADLSEITTKLETTSVLVADSSAEVKSSSVSVESTTKILIPE